MKRGMILLIALFAGLVLSKPVMAEDLAIVGTGSGMSILQSVADAFNSENPGTTVLVPKSIGSGGGVKAVGTDKNLLGRIARNIKDREKHYGLTYAFFSKIPVVFFVNKSVGINNLTPQEICGIYSGKITNWKDVGGKNAGIRVIRREDGDSSLSVLLKSFPGFSDITITAKSKTTYSDSETIDLGASKADTIAFGTYDNVRNAM